MLQRAPVCARGDRARNALFMDTAQIWYRQAMLIGLDVQLFDPNTGFDQQSLLVSVDVKNAIIIVQVHHPRARAGQVARGVTAANHDDASSTFPGEIHNLLDLGERARADVELRIGVEGPSPCMMGMRCGSAEGNLGVGLGDLVLNFVHDGEMLAAIVAHADRTA